MSRRVFPSRSNTKVLSDAELGLDSVPEAHSVAPRLAPRRATAVAYMTSSFLVGMDQSIVNVALPTFARDFHASVASVQWTVIAYVLAVAMWIPASGWLGDRFGTKRVFLYALAIFTIASVLCGQARNLPELIAARAIQGAGGGLVLPISLTMLWRAFPASERARVQRLMFIPVLIAPVSAPILGGVLIQDLSWRWIFYVNLPVGVVGMAISVGYLVEHAEHAESRFDFRGFIFGGVGLSLLLYAVSEGTEVGWTSVAILSTGLIGLAMLAYFVRVEIRAHDPMVRVELLRQRLFRAANSVSAFSAGGSLGIVYIAPIYLQIALKRSALSAGLTTFMVSIGVLVGTQTIGRLYGRVGPRRLAMVGLATSAIITLTISRVDGGTNIWVIRSLMFLGGLTNSTGVLPIQIATFSNIAPRDTGHASAIVSTVRQASTALGVAIVTTVVAAGGGRTIEAFRRGFVTAACMSAIGAAIAWFFVRDEDAKATMVRRVTHSSATSTE